MLMNKSIVKVQDNQTHRTSLVNNWNTVQIHCMIRVSRFKLCIPVFTRVSRELDARSRVDNTQSSRDVVSSMVSDALKDVLVFIVRELDAEL